MTDNKIETKKTDDEQKEKFDWTDCIKFTILRMRIVGIWPGGEDYKMDLYAVWSALYIVTFTWGHAIFQTLEVFFSLNDLKKVMGTLYVTLSEILIMLKAYLCVRNMKVLKQNLVTLNSDMFQPRNDRQIKRIKEAMSFWRINSNFFWLSVGTAVFFWSTYPVFDKSIKNRQLPFIAWYPYNTTVSPYYEITYAYQVLGVMASAATALTTDTLIAALHMYIALQFEILYDDITFIHDNESDAVEASKKLANCVVHHKAILKFAEDTGNFTNWIIFGQFFISGSSIGITMFHMTTVIPFSSEFFSITAYFFAVIVQTFLYCYFGNEVEVKSNLIPYAFFESDWIGADKRVKQEMIIMTERCQRPLKISALNLFYLSLETFMRILRVSYSYFALLHQMSSK